MDALFAITPAPPIKIVTITRVIIQVISLVFLWALSGLVTVSSFICFDGINEPEGSPMIIRLSFRGTCWKLLSKKILVLQI